MNKNILIAGVVIVAVVALGAVFFYDNNNQSNPGTTEAGDAMEKKDGEAMDAMEKKDGEAMDAMEKTDGEAMDAMEKKDGEAMEQGDAMTKNGSYESYSPEKLALAEKGKVVLFFRASWCPTCRALDANIRSNLSSIPAGVTILDVDYDNSTDLKKKYNVTYQHTMVQVDASGNQLAKWSGSPTLSDLVSKVI